MIQDGALVLSLPQAIDLFKTLVYLPACLLCYLALARRLPAFPRRVAVAMLLLQIPLLLYALDTVDKFHYWGALWHYDVENNIPSVLSSTMLAYAGAIGLLVAWAGRGRARWRQIYFLFMGLLLLAMGADEYFGLFKRLIGEHRLSLWERGYLVLGVGAAAATSLVAYLSRGRRLWHGATFAGLALVGAGGLLLDSAPLFCGLDGVFRLAGCEKPYAFEEILEHLGSWLLLAGMLGAFGETSPQPSSRLRRFICAIPFLWLLLIPLNAQVARLELRGVARQTSVRFAGDIQLRGYDMDAVTGAVNLSMYFSAPQVEYTQLRHFAVDLVDSASGESSYKYRAEIDLLHSVLPFGAAYAPIYRQRHEARYGSFVPPNRAHWVALGAVDVNALRRLDASDLRQLNDKQVILDEFVVHAPAVDAPAAPIATFDGGFALVDADLPAAASPGDALEIAMTWHSDSDSSEDYTQFLHFVHADTGAQWGQDQPPLGRRLPTRLWYAGMQDTESWQVAVPPNAAPGEYAVYTGLYRLADMQRLDAKDSAGREIADARAMIGALAIAESGR